MFCKWIENIDDLKSLMFLEKEITLLGKVLLRQNVIKNLCM